MRKNELSLVRQQLVDLLQRIDFGYIENLTMTNGEPTLDPLPRVVRDVKLSGRTGTRRTSAVGDFVLKAEVVELLRHLEEIRNGTVARLEVRHGLPFRILLEGIGNQTPDRAPRP